MNSTQNNNINPEELKKKISEKFIVENNNKWKESKTSLSISTIKNSTKKNTIKTLNSKPLNTGITWVNKKHYTDLLIRYGRGKISEINNEIGEFKYRLKKINKKDINKKEEFMKEILETLKNYQEDLNIANKIDINNISDEKIIERITKMKSEIEAKNFSIKEIIHQADKSFEEQKNKETVVTNVLENSEIKIGQEFKATLKDINLEKWYLLMGFGNKYIGSILFKNTLEWQKWEKINTKRLSHNIDIIVTDIKKNKEGRNIYHLKEIEKKEHIPLSIQTSSEKKEGESKPLVKKVIDYIISRQNAPHQPKPYIGISLDELYSKFKNDISWKENITDEKKIRAKIHSTLESYIRKNPETMKKDYFLPEWTYKNKEGNWELPEGKKPLLYYTIITKAIKKNKSP